MLPSTPPPFTIIHLTCAGPPMQCKKLPHRNTTSGAVCDSSRNDVVPLLSQFLLLLLLLLFKIAEI